MSFDAQTVYACSAVSSESRRKRPGIRLDEVLDIKPRSLRRQRPQAVPRDLLPTLLRRGCSSHLVVVLRKKWRPPKFFAPFKPLFSRVGIHDANRPERRSLLLDNRTAYGDLNFVAPERLLRVPEYLGRSSSEGGLDCNG
jgi:hypothetical protein